MKALKITLITLVALAVLFVAGGLMLPKQYEVERSLVIDAQPSAVFNEVNTLKNWDAWSPWTAKDPTIRNTYSGPESGVGAKVSWTSEEMGEGSQEILASEPPEHISTRLDFGEHGHADADWHFEAVDGQTRVRWGFSGETSGLMGGYFAMMMDSFVGSDFEDGLDRLKRRVESAK